MKKINIKDIIIVFIPIILIMIFCFIYEAKKEKKAKNPLFHIIKTENIKGIKLTLIELDNCEYILLSNNFIIHKENCKNHEKNIK